MPNIRDIWAELKRRQEEQREAGLREQAGRIADALRERGYGKEPEAVDSSSVDRLADLYMSAFGSQANEGAVAVVPVGPDSGGGGGGISLGSIALLGALGVGGWWLYKKTKNAA